MSIVVALANENEWCVVTDSQKTELSTGLPTFGAPKSKKVTSDLFVGYAGHVDACENILKSALAIHEKVKGNSGDPAEFVESLKLSIRTLELEHGYNCLDGFFFSFLMVGLYKNKPTILIFGTCTNLLVGGIQPMPNGTQVSFLAPDDVPYKECLNIYNRLTSELGQHIPLSRLGKSLVEEISQRSKYCGGETQILEYSRRQQEQCSHLCQ